MNGSRRSLFGQRAVPIALGTALLVSSALGAGFFNGRNDSAASPVHYQHHTFKLPSSGLTIAVHGNHLINGYGLRTRLLGVNRDGTDYACEQAWGIFDGPSTSSSIAAMASWHINAVRVLLNEGCWLNLFTQANDGYSHGRDPRPFEGTVYRQAILAYVKLLHEHGLIAILTLNSLAVPGGLGVLPMPDATYATNFWRSVASIFKSDPAVIFDLYGEPNNVSWSCWNLGCLVTTTFGTYQAVGMSSLVRTIRSTGAHQALLLGGSRWSSDESGWVGSLPHDPLKQLIVDFHTYNTTYCNTLSCWNSLLAPLAKSYPMIAGEFGEYDCSTPYSNAFMSFADAHGISYLGWAWDAISPNGWDCQAPSLIERYDGTASPEGAALHNHLQYLFTHHVLPPIP